MVDVIYNENCAEGLKRLEDNCVDLVVTSPPYDNIRDYDGLPNIDDVNIHFHLNI